MKPAHRPQQYAIPPEELWRPVTSEQLAAEYGCNPSTIRKRRRSLGITIDHKPHYRRGANTGTHLETRTPEERAVFAAFEYLARKAKESGATLEDAIEAFHRDSHRILAHVTYFGDTVRIRGRASWL